MEGKGGLSMGVKVRERKGLYRYLTVGLLIILFHISLAIPTIAEQMKDADAAYLRGDYATAFDLLKPLAEQGNPLAQHNLGAMYERGEGVPQDYVMAHMWYNLAASRYSASEEEKREKALKNRDLVASLMTPAQVAE